MSDEREDPVARKPRKKTICKDEPDGVGITIGCDGNGVVILRQYDFGLMEGASDEVVIPVPSDGDAIAKWLNRWVAWRERVERTVGAAALGEDCVTRESSSGRKPWWR